MNSPPGGTGGWVTSGTPSKRFSRRRPCQWMVDGRSIEFVKRTTTRVFWATRRSGPGYWPLKPYMTKVRPPILRFTMRASMATVSPSATGRISRGVAHAREAVSTPSPGRKGSTDGLTSAQTREHGVAQHHHDHVAGAADRVRRHGHVHGHVVVHVPRRRGVLGRGAGRDGCEGGERDGYLDQGGTTLFMRAYAIDWPRCSFMWVTSWSRTAQLATCRP